MEEGDSGLLDDLESGVSLLEEIDVFSSGDDVLHLASHLLVVTALTHGVHVRESVVLATSADLLELVLLTVSLKECLFDFERLSLHVSGDVRLRGDGR